MTEPSEVSTETPRSRRYIWYCPRCDHIFKSQTTLPRGDLAKGRSCYGPPEALHERFYDLGRYETDLEGNPLPLPRLGPPPPTAADPRHL